MKVEMPKNIIPISAYKRGLYYMSVQSYFMDLMKTWVKFKVNFASLIPGQHRAFEKSKEYDYSYVCNLSK